VEKKARVKRLNHQDDVRRSWATAYPLIEDFESILPEAWAEEQTELDSAGNRSLIQPPNSHTMPIVKPDETSVIIDRH